VPDDGADGGRRREGVKRMQAMARNCRNQSLGCQGRNLNGKNREGERTDAEHWDGPIRSSGEGS
jgi:hypothetical protein